MATLDLTPFGFTPTEGLVYQVLLSGGPGTGYAIARSAGLARANAYAALEGLVQKGAARSDGVRPRRYRAEPPTTLLSQIASRHGRALDRLAQELADVSAPSAPTLVEVDSPRSALQLVSHDVARAGASVLLLAPPDAYPLLAPALRRAAAHGLILSLASTGPVTLEFAAVRELSPSGSPWPGEPFLAVVDERSALIVTRTGTSVSGHWSSAEPFVAAARLAFRQLTGPA
ncbi:MAG TPA: helix-turn-helix domain-containing protein [Gemmatimonadales bacterium]|nr:helix-turn-helix domain-containing protein [Gemmatimonadales bacterium]